MMKKYTRTTTILSTIITIIEMTKIMVDLTNKYNLTDYTSYPTIYILISQMNRDTMLKSILVHDLRSDFKVSEMGWEVKKILRGQSKHGL